MLLIPLSATVITLKNFEINDFEKTLLERSWVLIFLSIILGFIQIIIDSLYFKNLAYDNNQKAKIWSCVGRSNKILESETKKINPTKDSSTHIPLILQAISIFLGLSMIIRVSISFLNHVSKCNF